MSTVFRRTADSDWCVFVKIITIVWAGKSTLTQIFIYPAQVSSSTSLFALDFLWDIRTTLAKSNLRICELQGIYCDVIGAYVQSCSSGQRGQALRSNWNEDGSVLSETFLPCEMKCIEESFASVHDVGFFMLYIISFRRQYRSTPLCPSRVLQFPSGVFAAEGFYVHWHSNTISSLSLFWANKVLKRLVVADVDHFTYIYVLRHYIEEAEQAEGVGRWGSRHQ